MAYRILIVDDDHTIRQVLGHIFKRAGYDTAEAANGIEAVHKIRRQKFDLVTMDMAMAHMDGVDAISIVQNESPVPIVVISAHLTESVQQDLQKRRIHHCLDKPFSAKDVLAVAQKILDGAP